jgi:serine/threonine protein kinase/tetratricopeptide (TPR) repeat protein
MSCATWLPYCARNLLGNFLHYFGDAMDNTRMKIADRFCGKCGARFFADAPQEFCSACLLESGLFTEEDLDAINSPDSVDPRSITHNNRTGHAGRMLADFGDYELLEEMGRGGQGIVYRARQKSLNRTVALKIVGLGQWATKRHLRRFHLEAEAAASLDHPCIVPIYEIGERDGSCYFSMKLIEGGPLDKVAEHEQMSPRQAAEMIARLARTSHYAHERGVLHRDIKPGNILIDAKGEPHLTDFGLARLVETESTITRTTEALGTPSYMAPEQAKGNNTGLTSATDVYGLGAVLYHLLTGHPPFAGGTTYQTIRLLLETDPRNPRLWNPKLDRDLSTICLKCLEKDPQRRYPTALALAQDLERWLKHEPIQARHTTMLARGRKWVRRNPAVAGLLASLVALATAIGVIIWKSQLFRSPPATGIAVLPFENLSSEKEDASLADGVQDDILTKLAKVAGLKVISRTSVMEYRGKRNIRQIGEALRVSHVLEGSVRKTGARVHLNAQLIDARTDSHVWAEQYDFDLNDLFGIQSEIAKKVAGELNAKISAAESLAIEQPITRDLTAFDLFARAKNHLLWVSSTTGGEPKLLQAVDLLNQAVARDSSFFQAYCELAYAHDLLYFFHDDHTPARLALAEEAIKTAFRLRPDSGEAHLAQAENLYRGHLNYKEALAELEIAGQKLPNNARVFEMKGYIQRRQGQWEESTRNLERALDLDPRNFFALRQIAISYGHLRRYPESASALDRAIAVEPNAINQLARAFVDLDWKADTGKLHQLIDSIRSKDPGALPSIADTWLLCALMERDAVTAQKALNALGETPLSDDVVQFSHPFVEGLIARMTKDEEKARSAFTAARAEQEKIVSVQPNYGPALCVLGLIDAALGRKDEAMQEGRRAVELVPIEEDAINGQAMNQYFAMIDAWAGEKELACERLIAAMRRPNSLSYGQLKLLPFWDPLRGDPRFEEIVASLAPK